MQARVQKLLILAGEQGYGLDGRDYQKLIQVFFTQYLPTPQFLPFFTQMLVRVIRSICLKQHFYAGLTASLSRTHPQAATGLIDSVVVLLQQDLSDNNTSEVINSLHYLAQLMNISLLNSLVFMQLLDDVLSVTDTCGQEAKRAIFYILTRVLPVCAYSLQEKMHYELKRFLQKLRARTPPDALLEYVFTHFNKGNLEDQSKMPLLKASFNDLTQYCPKIKINFTTDKLCIQQHAEEGMDQENQDQLEKQYVRNDGQLLLSDLERIITSFHGNKEILCTKVINLLQSQESSLAVKHVVEYLAKKSLSKQYALVYYSLLLALCNQKDGKKLIEECLVRLFNEAQHYDVSVIPSLASLLAWVVNNWSTQWEWAQFLEDESKFVQRHVALKLTIQKMMLVNEKYTCVLENYEPGRVPCEEEPSNIEEQQIFDRFNEELKYKTPAEEMSKLVIHQRSYELFLEALFRMTVQSQKHLRILSERYTQVFSANAEQDWTLINKIRNFFKNSLFHRLLYLKHFISQNMLTFNSYVRYIGKLTGKSEIDMVWIKIEISHLNDIFGKKNV